MSFCSVRSGLTVCLVTFLFLGAFSAYAQEQVNDESSQEVPAVESEASGESVPDTDGLTADEIRDAELDARKEEENASLRAKNDASALAVFQKGLDLEREGNYRKAAKRYLDAELLTSDKTVKLNALTYAARAFRQAELYGREFDCIERLINEHVGRIDFTGAVNRE